MQIVADSKNVLREIYSLLDDNSYSLVVSVSMNDISKKLNISEKRLNLCIHYLIESGYLRGDFSYNRNENATKEITILPSTINKIEHTSL